MCGFKLLSDSSPDYGRVEHCLFQVHSRHPTNLSHYSKRGKNNREEEEEEEEKNNRGNQFLPEKLWSTERSECKPNFPDKNKPPSHAAKLQPPKISTHKTFAMLKTRSLDTALSQMVGKLSNLICEGGGKGGKGKGGGGSRWDTCPASE